MKVAQKISLFVLFSIISGTCASQSSKSLPTYTKQQLLYIGIGPCNNGEVATEENHKGCSTKPIGYTIDAADAEPESAFVEVFAGNDTMNNKIVSPDGDHGGGSTESIGYLSKKPVRGGAKIRAGKEPCNNGIATQSYRHLGCGTRFLGYALPLR